MTISPTQTGRDNSIMLKSDHFHSDLSPRNGRYKQEDNNASLSDKMKVGAFADVPTAPSKKPELIMPNVPFSKLISDRIPSPSPQEDQKTTNNVAVINNEEDRNGNSPSNHVDSDPKTAGLTMVSTNDDFIMVDLKTPFAATNANSELGMFYREWQSAPPLQTFSDVPTLAEQVQDLTKQLETFESSMHEYDDVLQSLCQSPNNN